MITIRRKKAPGLGLAIAFLLLAVLFSIAKTKAADARVVGRLSEPPSRIEEYIITAAIFGGSATSHIWPSRGNPDDAHQPTNVLPL
jgi:hypothetical protein